MILSVSRRTDIPAFYSEWFFKRVEEGFLYVRNPMNPKQISKVIISPEEIEFIVFWTKNPSPMLNKLEKLEGYNYYFQFTVNPYDEEIEPEVPKKNIIIKSFKELSRKIGKKRVIWRYDPILLNDKIDINYHKIYFEKIAKELSDYTEKCIISFIDMYSKTKKNCSEKNIRELTEKEKFRLAEHIKEIGEKYNIKIETCAEKIDLSKYGIEHTKCIDDELIGEILRKEISAQKDKSQREECRCIKSVDIGVYNSCPNKCVYCYANFSCELVDKNAKLHDINSPLLIGNVNGDEKITLRKEKPVVAGKRYIKQRLF